MTTTTTSRAARRVLLLAACATLAGGATAIAQPATTRPASGGFQIAPSGDFGLPSDPAAATRPAREPAPFDVESTGPVAPLPAGTTKPVVPVQSDLPPVKTTTAPVDPDAQRDEGGIDAAQAAQSAAAPGDVEGDEPRLDLAADPTPDGAALAGILETYAQGTLAGEDSGPALARQAAALYAAAVRLAPDDARLARNLVETRLRAGDAGGAVVALNHYRSLRPDDTLAQIRFVDLSAADMQTADAKLDYLSRLADDSRVSDPVRSHAAAMASILYVEMLDEESAAAMVDRAVELDAYNPLALQLDYERRLREGAARPRRVQALARLVRSNPVQPAVLSRLAEELLDAGLAEEANDYYNAAIRAGNALGLPVPTRTYLDSAAVKFVTNRPAEVNPLLVESAGAMVEPTQDDARLAINFLTDVVDGHLLNVLGVDAAVGGEVASEHAQTIANIIRNTILLQTHAAINGEPPPPPREPGQPTPPTPLPDVVADAQRIRQAPDSPQNDVDVHAYATALSGLAWIDLYFLEQPTDDAILRALEILVPEDSATLVRLKGWQLWRQGQADAAAEKLRTVAGRDPLSALGLLLMGRDVDEISGLAPAQGGGASIAAQGQALLDANPAGLTGAFLADALRPKGVRLTPGDEAPAVREALSVVEPDLLAAADPARAAGLYSLSADAGQVSHAFGEPMLLDLTLRNTGRHVLTLGPDGLVRPPVRLDARVSNIPGQGGPQPVPAAALPEWSGATRLDPGEKIVQRVRLDGPQLSAVLASAPQATLTMLVDVTSNPVTVQTEQGPGYATGPAGQSYRLPRRVDRAATPMDTSDPRVAQATDARLESLRGGEPLERLRAAQLVLGQIEYLSRLAQQVRERGQSEGTEPEQIDEQIRPFGELAGRLADALRRAGDSFGPPRGPDAASVAWLKFAAANVAVDAASRDRLIESLLSSPAFESRLVGLLAVSTLIADADRAAELAGPVAESDADPTVRAFARNLLAYLGQRQRAGE